MQNLILKCKQCGAKNRIPAARLADGPVCGRCKARLDVLGLGKVLEVSEATFTRDVLESPLPVLLDCWAPWCGPCRSVAPVLETLAADYAGKLRIAKLNVDENQTIAARLGVQSIPTMIIFAGGMEKDRMVGALPRPQIEARLAAFVGL